MGVYLNQDRFSLSSEQPVKAKVDKKEMMIMAEKLKKLECDPKCGFAVQSHDEKEIVEIAVQHAKKLHNMKITEKDAKEMIKDAA
jgi:predicted small metal-binding protein